MLFLGKDYTLYKDIISEYKDKEIIVSCQYPFKIDFKCSFPIVNIHYGLLPFFRGCDPIYWQMLKSDSVGVTLHYVDGGFDTGDIIDTFSFPHFGMTAEMVYAQCGVVGVGLLRKNIDNILNGVSGVPQGDGFYYKRGEAEYNKRVSVLTNDRMVRALTFPGKQYARTIIGGVEYDLVPVKYDGGVK